MQNWYNHEVLKWTSDMINKENEIITNNKFIIITRIISIIILLIILYLSFDTYINSLIMWYEYGWRNNRPSVLLFIPAMLLFSIIWLRTKIWFQIYNTVLVWLFIFYWFLWLYWDSFLINSLEITVSVLWLILFIYSIFNTKLYWLKKSELMILKLK